MKKLINRNIIGVVVRKHRQTVLRCVVFGLHAANTVSKLRILSHKIEFVFKTTNNYPFVVPSFFCSVEYHIKRRKIGELKLTFVVLFSSFWIKIIKFSGSGVPFHSNESSAENNRHFGGTTDDIFKTFFLHVVVKDAVCKVSLGKRLVVGVYCPCFHRRTVGGNHVKHVLGNVTEMVYRKTDKFTLLSGKSNTMAISGDGGIILAMIKQPHPHQVIEVVVHGENIIERGCFRQTSGCQLFGIFCGKVCFYIAFVVIKKISSHVISPLSLIFSCKYFLFLYS